ncbi:MAG: hydroxyphenylacetyl-CoA thioesterase PaaI [Rhizobiaceae bacterium]
MSTKQLMNNEDKLAKACADIMWENDDASKGLGMKIEEVRLGYARLSMKVRQDMTNGHDNAHGGFIFSLADSAFAFACNTRNQITVGQHCSISYLAPGKFGDVLTATALELHHASRSGIYNVAVINQEGTKIAEFRGHSRTIKGQHLPKWK